MVRLCRVVRTRRYREACRRICSPVMILLCWGSRRLTPMIPWVWSRSWSRRWTRVGWPTLPMRPMRLSLAAEIAERQGELERAVALAGRAAEASHARRPDYGHPRALYGELLIRSGREEEGLAVLGALRPLLTRDEDAIYYVSEALEQADRTDVAVQWLTAALDTALQRRSAVVSRRGDRVYEQAACVPCISAAATAPAIACSPSSTTSDYAERPDQPRPRSPLRTRHINDRGWALGINRRSA